jgi:hypothetical protein
MKQFGSERRMLAKYDRKKLRRLRYTYVAMVTRGVFLSAHYDVI